MKIKDRKSAAREAFKKPAGKLEPCDLDNVSRIPPGMTRAFRNNRYTVMIFDNKPTTAGPAVCALVQRHDNEPIPGHWREMQNIKNEVFGREVTAIEYYPAESELLDTHNIYWMWIFPEGIIPKKI